MSIFNTDSLIFGLDADETFTPAAVREKLPDDFISACRTFNEATNGRFFIFTNSARHGLDEMMGGWQAPALVSQGTLCRFEEGGDYIPHPELNADIKDIINDIDTLAKQLIAKHAPEYQITYNGRDIHSGGKFLKPEHKETSYCVVFPELIEGSSEITKDIVNDVHHKLGLDGLMHIHNGRDAIEFVPFDKSEKPFDKLKGIQWVMGELGNQQLVIAEDSNEGMLRHTKDDYGSYNIGVGAGLADSDNIHAHLGGITEFREAFVRVAQHVDRNGVVDFKMLETPHANQRTTPVPQVRHARVG